MIVQREFETKTGGRLDALDITDDIIDVVRSSGINTGSVLVFSPHTTCCVLLGYPGPELIGELEAAVERIAPSHRYYFHDDLDLRTENLVEDEPPNAPAHIAHAFIGKASESLPVVDGQVVLGPSRRVLFVELDCSRPRRYTIQAMGE